MDSKVKPKGCAFVHSLNELCIVLFFISRMVASMVFYGLSLNTGMLYGDYYINFLLSILMEFPGHALPIFMIDRIGRKKSHIIYMTVGGLSCLSTIFTVNYGGKGKAGYLPCNIRVTESLMESERKRTENQYGSILIRINLTSNIIFLT